MKTDENGPTNGLPGGNLAHGRASRGCIVHSLDRASHESPRFKSGGL